MASYRELIVLDTRQDLFATFNINHRKNRRAKIQRTCKESSAPNAKVVFDGLMIYPKMLLVDRAFSLDTNCSLSRCLT